MAMARSPSIEKVQKRKKKKKQTTAVEINANNHKIWRFDSPQHNTQSIDAQRNEADKIDSKQRRR